VLGIFIGFLYLVFVVTALLLIAIILLQEAKGGGLAGAFGGAGTEAFGVKAGGINRFTATVAGIFLGSAVVIGILSVGSGSVVSGEEPPAVPALPDDIGSAAPTDGSSSTTPPAAPADGTKPPAESGAKPAESGTSTPPAGEPKKEAPPAPAEPEKK